MRTRLGSVNVQKETYSVSPKLRGDYRRRVIIHQRSYLEALKQGNSRTQALKLARKAEHHGMSKRQIQHYEGHLGSIAKRR